MTTFSTFVEGLHDLAVEGVKRVFDGVPRAIGSMDLPAMWVQLPEGGDNPITCSGEGGWPDLIAEVWIAIQPTAQGIQPEQYDATIEIMDNLQAALQAVTSGTICKSKLTWTIRGGFAPIGETNPTVYWSVVARITGKG